MPPIKKYNYRIILTNNINEFIKKLNDEGDQGYRMNQFQHIPNNHIHDELFLATMEKEL